MLRGAPSPPALRLPPPAAAAAAASAVTLGTSAPAAVSSLAFYDPRLPSINLGLTIGQSLTAGGEGRGRVNSHQRLSEVGVGTPVSTSSSLGEDLMFLHSDAPHLELHGGNLLGGAYGAIGEPGTPPAGSSGFGERGGGGSGGGALGGGGPSALRLMSR